MTNKTDLTPEAGAKTVLIVEDNDLNMRLFCDVLDAFGFQTVQTRYGAQAMDMARKYRPNLIIMDIQLADASGLDVTRNLKNDQELAGIPVLAVTAFAMKSDEKRILAAGAEGYLSKPISVANFISTVRRFMV